MHRPASTAGPGGRSSSSVSYCVDTATELIATLDAGDYVEGAILRRLRHRMESLDISDLPAYRDYVRRSPAELESLRALLSISHTGFFRDPARWEAISTTVVPALLAQNRQLRVWSTGCATGEEAYTLAMIFAEQTGLVGLAHRVSIFGTDVSRTSLAIARAGTYGALRTAAVPAALREKYVRDGVICQELRSAVRFARHDLLNDPPFMRIDLLVCRNTLLYMRRDAQAQVLAKLHVALAPGGVLFTGPADGLPIHRRLFQRFDAQLYRAREQAKREALLAAGARRG